MPEYTTQGPRPVVFLLHGIRTRGAWCDDAASYFQNAGFLTKKLDYGNFSLFQFLRKGAREAKVKWLLNTLHSELKAIGSKETPSIVAHSFGTYLVAKILERYREKGTFDKIIFCGSIVPQSFEWDRICKEGVVNQVLNQYGGLDFPARIASEAVPDAGAAGYAGFNFDADGRVIQQGLKEFKHGDYFYAQNYEHNWTPFLNNMPVRRIDHRPAPLPFFRTIIITTLLNAALIIGTYFITRYYAVPEGSTNPSPPADPMKVVREKLLKPVFNDNRRAIFIVREDAAVIPVLGVEGNTTSLSLRTFPPEFEDEIKEVVYESDGFAASESDHTCDASTDSGKSGKRLGKSALDHFKVSWRGSNVKESIIMHIFLKKLDSHNMMEYNVVFSMNGIE